MRISTREERERQREVLIYFCHNNIKKEDFHLDKNRACVTCISRAFIASACRRRNSESLLSQPVRPRESVQKTGMTFLFLLTAVEQRRAANSGKTARTKEKNLQDCFVRVNATRVLF